MVKRIAVVVLALSVSASSGLRAQQNPPPPPPSEQDLAKRVAEQPTDLTAQLHLVRLYIEGKRFAEAEAMLTRALSVVRQQRMAAEAASLSVQGGIPQAPLRIGGDIKEPKKLRDVKPAYPEIAQAAGVQGIVILETVIDVDGTVRDAKVLRSVPLLDQAALDAVRQWVFTPTVFNGVPVPVIMTVTVNFSLGR
jgi:protein TonB